MSKLLPYETIVKAHEGDPDAVDAVLSHYAGYIRYFSKVHGQVNAEVEEYVKQQLIAALFKFRFDRSTKTEHWLSLAVFPSKFTIHLFSQTAGHDIIKLTIKRYMIEVIL